MRLLGGDEVRLIGDIVGQQEGWHGGFRGRVCGAGRPQNRQRQAPPAAGDPADCLVHPAERRRDLCRHGAVRPGQAGLPWAVLAPRARRAVARHLQPGLPPARPSPVPGLLCRLHAPVRRDLPRRGRGRRQDAAAFLRAGGRRLPAAPGECLGLRAAPSLGPTRGRRQVERDHCRAQAAGDADAGGDDRHRPTP